MGRFDKKEPKLNEVKAVLQRLQGFPEDEKPAGPLAASVGARQPGGGAVVATIIFGLAGAFLGAAYLFGNLTTSDPQKTAVATTEPPPSVRSDPQNTAVVTTEPPPPPSVRSDTQKTAVVIPPPSVRPDPQKTAVVTTVPPPPSVRSEAVKAALEAARALMAKGQVRAAREQLLALAWKGSPDAAWDVARSYDPNVLATLPQPDAVPDIPEASRWYRTWYETAVKEGMVANSISIDRIIGAMQRSAQR